MLKMYQELAHWWPLLSQVADYAEEADFYLKLFNEAGLPANATLLEIGSGGGNNAFYMKSRFSAVTLADLSPHMQAVSRNINPDCEHVLGDMRSLRLGRTFDAVFIHDAICYMTSLADLRAAILTAYEHCKPGGLAIFCPDTVTELFEEETDHGGHDGDGRSLRYLEWSYDPDPHDSTYVTEYVYVLRQTGQPVVVEHEQHTLGLFQRQQWLDTLRAVGFEPHMLHDEFDRDVFWGRKPAS